MRHVEKALNKMLQNYPESCNGFIQLENIEDNPLIAPIVKFAIQSAPVGYCPEEGGTPLGVNGCQALDMLKYVKCLFESLNEAFPCIENEFTLEKLNTAIFWQDKRTANRIRRNVEGRNEK